MIIIKEEAVYTAPSLPYVSLIRFNHQGSPIPLNYPYTEVKRKFLF